MFVKLVLNGCHILKCASCGLHHFLASRGCDADEIKLAISHIISRAVYPATELETNRRMKENSAICEVTGYDIENITKDRLYNITKKLYSEKEASVQD